MAKEKSTNGSLSYDTQVLIVIILLIFVYPLGLLLMWLWMHTWPKWLKIAISIPLGVTIIIMFVVFYFIGNALKEAKTYQKQELFERQMERRNSPFRGDVQDWDAWEKDLQNYIEDTMKESMEKSMPSGGTSNTY